MARPIRIIDLSLQIHIELLSGDFAMSYFQVDSIDENILIFRQDIDFSEFENIKNITIVFLNGMSRVVFSFDKFLVKEYESKNSNIKAIELVMNVDQLKDFKRRLLLARDYKNSKSSESRP